MSLRPPRFAAFLLACLLATAAPAADVPPPAAAVANPYEATVKVDDESDASRDKGLRMALIDVLRRAVGRQDSAVSPILGRAASLVQSYAFVRDEAADTVAFRATFDPAATNQALKDNGLPVFGLDADVIEAWIIDVRGVNRASDYAAVMQHFGRLRGVKRIEVSELRDDQVRLRMIVEGGIERAAELALVGGRMQSDGAGGYVLGH